MKRFYKSVDVAARDGGFAVELDGKAMRTPGQAPLTLPTRALAEDVAGEWASVSEIIKPETMLFTKLSNTAIDRGGPLHAGIVAELARFADSDLVCYRMKRPKRLALLQSEHWDPVLSWLQEACGISLTTTFGLIDHDQPPSSLEAIAEILKVLSPFELVAVHALTTNTGSVSIALAHAFGPLTADAAWAAAIVDETFQMNEWGEDADALEVLSKKRKEFLAASHFWTIVRNDI